MADPAIIVTGAGGRIGRLLRRLWPEGPVWLTRAEWDILHAPPPRLPKAAVWLDLSGVTQGDVSLNPLLAARVADAAKGVGARLVYMSSASVYPGGSEDMRETTPPAPASAYGQSKLAAEARLSDAVVLRLGNLAGADALLGVERSLVTLDPVAGQSGGPVRSYIGPHVLADVLWQLSGCVQDLPKVLNIAQPMPVAMADLLVAAGRPWAFGPVREGVIPRVGLATDRLEALVPLPVASPATLVADLNRLGGWPP